MFYFISDLLDDISTELRYNQTAQMIAVVVSVVAAIACFVGFIAAADPTPSSVSFWFPN